MTYFKQPDVQSLKNVRVVELGIGRSYGRLEDSGQIVQVQVTGRFRQVLSGRERERNVLFNDALNTFYLRLYGVKTYG